MEYPKAYGQTNTASNSMISSHFWASYGLTYSREIFDNSKHQLTVGATIKLLQGIQSLYARAKDFNYKANADSTMNIYNSYIEYGHSNNFAVNPIGNGYGFNGKPSIGLDIGANYFIKSEKYSKQIVNYLFKFSASIIDIGSISYNKQNSNDFIANVTNWNVRNLSFNYNTITQNLDDTINKRFGFAAASSSYKMKLPTVITLQAEGRMSENTFINFTAQIPQNNINTLAFSKENAYLAITPRVENNKGFMAALPIQYYPTHQNTSAAKVSMGLILQLGWVVIGTNHLSDIIFNNSPNAFDIFMLLKFSSIKKEAKIYDQDNDKVPDKQDLCPTEAGKPELMGCPDKDNDGIADKDDKCPDLPGKIDLNGCPDKDNDGVIDTEDECPDAAGSKTLKGCPDKDNDGIADKYDNCPDIPGTQEFHGCPPPKIDGQILLTEKGKEPARNLKIYLIKENCEKQDSSITDQNGYFKFDIKDTSQTYFVKVSENNNEDILKNKARFFMAKNDSVVRISKNLPCNKFVFTQLPYEKYPFSDLKRDGFLNISGNLLVVGTTTEPLKNKKLIIRNFIGDILDTVYTNEFGSFTFKYLDYEQSYLITFAENDLNLPANTKIILTNKNGKEIKSFQYIPGEPFKFELLPYDKTTLQELKVEDTDLNITIRGFLRDVHFKPFRNAKIIVTDKDTPLQEITTNAQGLFTIDNLQFKQGISFIISSDQNDTIKRANVILITDTKNKVIKRLVRGLGGEFKINILELEKTTLSEYQVNDPWLKVLKLKNKNSTDTIKIMEKINYALNSYKPDIEGMRVLDKVIQIMKDNALLVMKISSHTDSRGNDKHNMQLSEKRAKFAYDYIISKGIEPQRLSYIGYGESKILNKCKNNIKCSEEEHAVNRRTEFDIQTKAKD